MPSTKDVQPNDRGVFALFKGDSGSGKSVAALSFPEPYVFDFDKKMPNISLKHFSDKEVYWDTFDDIFAISEKMNQLWDDCPYETLIFDSITTLVVTILNSISKIKGDKIMDTLARFQKTGAGNKQLELMGYDYYNGETRFIEQYWLDLCKALWARPGNPKNVIITAHVMTAESAPDIKTKVITTTRRVVTAGRSVAAYIPTQFDDSWLFAYEMEMDGKNRHVVLTQGVGEDSAKTSFRLPYKIDFTGTPPLYEDGNLYEKFQKIIKGDITL